MENTDAGVPPDLEFSTQVFGLNFSPTDDVVASGNIDGHVSLYHYATKGNKHLLTLRAHEKSVRALDFSTDGKQLFTVSRDKSIAQIDLNSGKVKWRQSKAHTCPINALLVDADSSLMFTGDDEGHVIVWDTRTSRLSHSFKENSDYVADMMRLGSNSNLLLCASGDGTLAVLDIRKNVLEAASDNLEDELLSIAVMKNGTKVVCGSQGGVLDIFSVGDWGDISDRFPGHPESIESIIPISEDVLLTGSSDGLIRAVNIHPNNFLGVVGAHEEFPVERLALNHNGELLASISHDQCIKFWNIGYFYELMDEDDSKALTEKMGDNDDKELKKRENADFFSGL
jgi:WD40 repeat protein